MWSLTKDMLVQYSMKMQKKLIKIELHLIKLPTSVQHAYILKKKKKINWDLKEKQLKEICNRFRKNDGSYDILIPGSGGKDSAFTAHILKYKYMLF